jgi:hypothetical protein
VPELGTVIIKGMKPFRAFINERYIEPGKTLKSVRRHTQGNYHVVSHTPTTAKALFDHRRDQAQELLNLEFPTFGKSDSRFGRRSLP